VTTLIAPPAPPAPQARTAPSSRRGKTHRLDAGSNITLMAVAFGASVILTRAFLAVSGYPRVGGGTFHIAHALWGGLLLIIATAMTLMRADNRVYRVAAVLAGVGTGLFVDEIGKFMTSANDYFFPLAAPLVYLAVLGMVWFAQRVSRNRELDSRSAMYAALAQLGWEVDGVLTTERRTNLYALLDSVDADPSASPEMTDLAARLRAHLATASTLTELAPSRLDRLGTALHRIEASWLPQLRLRILVIGLSVLLAVTDIIETIYVLRLVASPPTDPSPLTLPEPAPSLPVPVPAPADGTFGAVITHPPSSDGGFGAVITHAPSMDWKGLTIVCLLAAANLTAATLLLVGVGLFVRGCPLRAVTVLKLGLLVDLCLANVIAVSYNVGDNLIGCVVQLAALALVIRYRQRFLDAGHRCRVRAHAS